MISILQKEEKINENEKLTNNEKVNEEKENKETALKVHKSNKKVFIIIIAIILIFILLISGFSIFTIMVGKSDKIINGIKVDEIDLSNNTVLEAENKVNEYLNKKMDINFVFNDNNFQKTVKPEEMGININTDKLIKDAYSYGRNDNFLLSDLEVINFGIFGKQIDLEVEFDNDIFNKFISELNIGIENSVKQPVFYVEGTELIINAGKEGNAVNETVFKKEIIEKFKQQDFTDKVINLPLENVKPEKIDIEKIYQKIHKEPQNAYVSKEPFEFHPHSEGIDFAISISEAKEILKEEKEQYKIPLKVILPEITNDKIGDEAFPDKLGSFSTNFSTADWNRTENIKLSVSKVNGTVLMPGEEFSYNDTIGPTTPEAGYKPGAAYIAGKVVTDYGGGVCQTSTTIYNAVLYANLDVTSRTSHYYSVGYVPVGRDATVYSPNLDFKFKNNRKYPIKIKAEVDGGTILVDIFGVKEDTDYEVELESFIVSYLPIKVEYENDNSLNEGTEVIKESGSNGFKTETYKILKKDGEVVSKSLISTDYYSGHTRVIRKGTKKVEEQKNNQVNN